MKKLLILAVMAVGAVLGAVAQDGGNKRVQVSVHAGIGEARWIGSDAKSFDGDDFNGSDLGGKFAYRLGVGLDFSINRIWGFRTGLNFEGLGAAEEVFVTMENPDTGNSGFLHFESTVSPLYLEVPLMATARVYNGQKFGIVLNFGPYVGVGVGGKISVEGTDNGEDHFSWSEKLYEEGSSARRFDMGVGFGIGFEVKRFVFSMDSRFGLLHVSEGMNVYNCATFLGVGYKF